MEVIMKSTARDPEFKQNAVTGERIYPFHSGEENNVQNSINKIKNFLNGVTSSPEVRRGTGAWFAAKTILENNNMEIRECFKLYKPFHLLGKNLPQGKPNPKDRFLRYLSVWLEAGAISIENYKIHFEPILVNRLKSEPVVRM